MTSLIVRLEAMAEPDNAVDVLVAVATFKPDKFYAAMCSNAAGTKIVCTARDGSKSTFWADDYTRTPESRALCIAILKAKEASHDQR